MTGYCTTDDVRRVFQDSEFTGALAASSKQAVVDAIEAQTQWIQKATKKHWYVSGGISEDDENVVDTAALTRDDEHGLPTHGGYVVGAYGGSSDAWTPTTGTVFDASGDDPDPKAQLRLAFGDLDDDTIPAYTRLRLERKNAETLNELHVVNETGGYDDWVADSAYAGGVGTANRGDDYWVRINNDGESDLYLDVHAMDDDLPSLANTVYVDFDFGEDNLPQGVRQGVSRLAAAELVQDDEFRTAIADQGQLMALETKAQAWERQGRAKLRPHLEEAWALEGE